jgi:RNA polymerase sigma-70 factor, ECF subfamily
MTDWNDPAQVRAELAKIGQKDQAAFERFYRAMAGKVYAFLQYRLGDAGRAEELTADTLYEIWKNPEQFRGESKLSTFLLGVARFKMLHALRDADPLHEDLEEFEAVLESKDASGFELVAERQRREGVRHCIEKLPGEQRDCLHLVFFEGLGLKEVAMIQHSPENTIKTRLFQARQKLKNCLRLFLKSEGE